MRLTLEQWADRMERAADRLPAALLAAEGASLEEALRTARALSGGPFSLAALAAMGHPYARRAPAPPADPAVINRQTGRFEASWYIVPPAAFGIVGSGIVSFVENDAPEGQWLDGTLRMIERPITERLADMILAARSRRVENALYRALEGVL